MSVKRSVAILFAHNADGKFLLQHRAADAKRLPNYWGFFGGGLEAHESPEDALRRELKEELNYVVKNPLLLFSQAYDMHGHAGTKHVFAEKFDESQCATLIQSEGQGMGWFTESDIKDMLVVEHDRAVIKKAEHYLGL